MYHSGNELIDPAMLFEKVGLEENMHVADFGCGRTGHIVFPVAMRLGERGLVYAVDIMKDILEIIQKRAQMEGFTDIRTVWSDVEKVGGTSIPKGSLDIVFLVNTLVHSDKKESMLEEAQRLLKQKGRIVIVDWVKTGLPFGPKTQSLVDFDALIRWGRTQSFAVQNDFSAGPYHRGLILYKHE